ncbi:MAG: hypothetical protein K6U12_02435 [Armatimonadetes bacterium]|nr:hypothetical protein [Armatimonadota bacterium]
MLSLLDADGREPLPICRAHREWVISRYRDEAMIAYWYYADDLPVGYADAHTDQHALKHIRNCPKCRAWIHAVIPSEVLRRQRRLSRYCCAAMFVAVEEYKLHRVPRIRFTMFRGEDPCWMIEDYAAFLRFCPWCGKPLPDAPFIPEGED